jgi:hypothetical protein
VKRAAPWALVVVLLVALLAAVNDSPTPGSEQKRAAASAPATTPNAAPTAAARRASAGRVAPVKASKRAKPTVVATDLVSCDANIRVKASTTTCPFAQNVFYEYYRATLGYPRAVTVRAWSPAADRHFDVKCSGVESIVCRAGDGARVGFPARAVLAYDDEQAEHFAATRETGTTDAEEAPADDADRNIPNYENGTGYRVQCADGMYSQSGGRPGACSGHGGVGADFGEEASSETPEPDYGAGDEIPNYDNGTGYRVRCADGMYSQSGGRSGACSGHGGVG